MQLDKLHIAILDELQKDSRLSNAEIGRRVGLTPPAVSERIKNLEKWKIIKGFKVILDYELLGYPENVMIGINVSPAYKNIFLKKIEGMNGVTDVIRTTGKYCYYLFISAKTNVELDKILAELETIGETVTVTILSQPKSNLFLNLSQSCTGI